MKTELLAALLLTLSAPLARSQALDSALPAPLPGGFLGGTDSCTAPTAIAGQASFPFDQTAATTGTQGQTESLCLAFASTAIDDDVWFAWTANADGCATLTTCGSTAIDTKIAAYPGSGCPAPGSALACNDDACGLQTTIAWPVANGATYTLQVGTFPGAAGGTGSFALSIAPCPMPAPIEIVGHYKLDETSGLVAIDSSPNGFDGGFQGGVTLGLPGAAPGTNLSAELDNNAQGHVLFSGNPVWDAMDRDLSVAAWIRPQSYGLPNGISRIFGNVLGSWTCGIRTTGLRFTTSGILDYDLPATIPLNVWTHVAFVFDMDFDVTFYVDGVDVGTLSGTSPANAASSEWRIGSWDNVIEYFDGNLDDVQVYRGALTAAQVASLYNNPGSVAMNEPGTARCFGDGSSGTCPCGNMSGVGEGEGCTNLTGDGAILAATGDASLGNDTLSLSATQTVNQPGIFFQGDNDIDPPLIFGDGLRCCGMNVVRIGTYLPSGNATDTANGNLIGGQGGPIASHTGNAGLSAGDSRCYQWWYRDPTGSCGSGFNLSNAYTVLWGP